MDLVMSQGEAKQKRPGLFEPKASFQGAAQRALEISRIHMHAASNTGDVDKKLQRLVKPSLIEESNMDEDSGRPPLWTSTVITEKIEFPPLLLTGRIPPVMHFRMP